MLDNVNTCQEEKFASPPFSFPNGQSGQYRETRSGKKTPIVVFLPSPIFENMRTPASAHELAVGIPPPVQEFLKGFSKTASLSDSGAGKISLDLACNSVETNLFSTLAGDALWIFYMTL